MDLSLRPTKDLFVPNNYSYKVMYDNADTFKSFDIDASDFTNDIHIGFRKGYITQRVLVIFKLYNHKVPIHAITTVKKNHSDQKFSESELNPLIAWKCPLTEGPSVRGNANETPPQ